VLNVEGLSRQALYVGCSRARTLKGLFLEGEFKPPECSATDPIELEMKNIKSRQLQFNENPDAINQILLLTRLSFKHSSRDGLICDTTDTQTPVTLSRPHSEDANVEDAFQEVRNLDVIQLKQIGAVNIYQSDIDSLRPGIWITDAVRINISFQTSYKTVTNYSCSYRTRSWMDFLEYCRCLKQFNPYTILVPFFTSLYALIKKLCSKGETT